MNESNLHHYQKQAVAFILERPYSALMIEMGLGKTITTLTAIDILMYETLDVNKVLVIAPKRVAENVWTSELKEWSHLGRLKVSRIIGNPMQRKAALAAKADIYIVSRDNIAWLCGQYGGGMLPFDMCVIDESSSFKSHDSLRFKALSSCSRALTGLYFSRVHPHRKALLTFGRRYGYWTGVRDWVKPSLRTEITSSNLTNAMVQSFTVTA